MEKTATNFHKGDKVTFPSRHPEIKDETKQPLYTVCHINDVNMATGERHQIGIVPDNDPLSTYIVTKKENLKRFEG